MASIVRRGKNWYYRFTDANGHQRTRKGCEDRSATERMAIETEKTVAWERLAQSGAGGESFTRYTTMDSNEWIYFVRADRCGLIKIGVTRGDPNRRLSNLLAMSPVNLKPLGMILGGRREEADLHWRFREHHHHGEWFKPAEEILEFIRTKCSPWIGSPRTPRSLMERYATHAEMEIAKANARKRFEEIDEEINEEIN